MKRAMKNNWKLIPVEEFPEEKSLPCPFCRKEYHQESEVEECMEKHRRRDFDIARYSLLAWLPYFRRPPKRLLYAVYRLYQYEDVPVWRIARELHVRSERIECWIGMAFKEQCMNDELSEASGKGTERFGEEQKLAMLKRAFERLKLPVDFDKVPAWHKVDLYFASVRGKAVLYPQLKRRSFEELLAETAAAIFKEFYEQLRREAKDRGILAHAAYYHIVGQLGRLIREDIPEEKQAMKIPHWLKRLEKPPLFSIEAQGGFHADHTYYSQDGAYISEPYNMSMKDFENLAGFCREHGLTFMVHGESGWFPGHTFRVIIKPEERLEP
jgi:hypothetical protein